MRNFLKKPSVIIFLVVLIVCVLLSVLSYRLVTMGGFQALGADSSTPSPTKTTVTPTPAPKVTPTPGLTTLPVQPPANVLGVAANQTSVPYPGIPWVRLSYTSCGWGDLRGNQLRNVVESFHKKGTRVLLTICQRGDNAGLFNPAPLNDVAQANADAVQCGNEEMKQDSSVSFLYVAPEHFAKFYDLCEHAVHAVRSNIPVLLGSLDPHVGGIDFQPLQDQVSYLDAMQDAMNNSVHPGGNWDWHKQALGLIDSWHNGFPDQSVNSLAALFHFWADQFQVDVNRGALGNHLWVVEGTGCFKGCGINSDSSYEVAVSHVVTLITDVQTAMRYKVPFFYFSGSDFKDQGFFWPIGILDAHNHSKPIRQDLRMGAISLTMSCPGHVKVVDQEALLAKMYAHCALPGDTENIIRS